MQILLNSIAVEPNRWSEGKIPHFRLESLLEDIARAGFDAIEVWQNHLALLEGEEVESLVETARSFDLGFPIIGMYPRFHLEGEEREAELNRFRSMAEKMNLIDADIIKLMPGGLPSGDLNPELWEKSVGFMREVLEATAQYDILFTLETHGGTVADDPDALERFMEDLNSERIEVCWQPYDFSSTGKAIKLFDRFSGEITHLHLQGRKGGDMELLEHADIDYRQVLGHIFNSDFDGYISIEFVRDCVVDSPDKFDLQRVLDNARRDREFVESIPGYSAG
ncbi:MAG: sugar phosphate isomerase/epimerase family protein [Planctomycetota bacterium]